MTIASPSRTAPGFALELPPGRAIELPGRGTTWIHEIPGPPSAPVAVLLHGWTATAALNWLPSLHPLGRRFRVIALDHCGHGRGIRCRDPFRLEDCADEVAALARVLGIPRLIAVGYSMGGPIAQLLWRRHPGLTQGLVLCATSSNFKSENSRAFAVPPVLLSGLALGLSLTPRQVRVRLARTFVAPGVREERLRRWIADEMSRSDPIKMVQAGRALSRFSSEAWIGDVGVPAAVVVTLGDGIVPPERQLDLARKIPGATVHAVRGNHAVCVARPDLFVPALLEACASVARRAG